jgi:hypothetical protein
VACLKPCMGQHMLDIQHPDWSRAPGSFRSSLSSFLLPFERPPFRHRTLREENGGAFGTGEAMRVALYIIVKVSCDVHDNVVPIVFVL